MNTTRLRLGILFIGFFLTSSTLIPTQVIAQSSHNSLKSGPYVDKLLYKVISQQDEQVQALIDNEIDIVGDMIAAESLDSMLRHSRWK